MPKNKITMGPNPAKVMVTMPKKLYDRIQRWKRTERGEACPKDTDAIRYMLAKYLDAEGVS